MTKSVFESRLSEAYIRKEKLDQLWADIEAERGVVVDWSRAPDWASGVALLWDENGKCYDKLETIPRPAPKYREMDRTEKLQKLLSLGFIAGWSTYINDSTIDDLCKAAGVDVRVKC